MPHSFPPENSAFRSLVITGKRATRALSLAHMRERMIAAGPFQADFFIGGMEGVEEEFAALRGLETPPPYYPVGSTGAAARMLLEEHRRSFPPEVLDALRTDTNYFLLFRRLSGLTASRKTEGGSAFSG